MDNNTKKQLGYVYTQKTKVSYDKGREEHCVQVLGLSQQVQQGCSLQAGTGTQGNKGSGVARVPSKLANSASWHLMD